jgi:hypothetical protein
MSVKERNILNGATERSYTRQSEWRQRTILVVGDIIIFLVFAAIGRRSHEQASNVLGTAVTALPFAVGWFLISPLMGAYRRVLMANPGKMALRTFLAWLAAWPVAMALRVIFVDHGNIALKSLVSFSIVTLITNSILLQLWRVPFAFVNRRRQR